MHATAHIPLRWIGPIKIRGEEVTDEVFVPLATYETPLWPSTERGAAVTSKAGGISVTIIDDRMTRSIVVEAKTAQEAAKTSFQLETKREEIKAIAEKTSSYVRFLDMHSFITGNLLFIRFEMQTGDAAGHNMVTKASDAILEWICRTFDVVYVSISGNVCTDKKVSCVNGILGRGKSVIADVVIPEKLCAAYLKTTPEKIVQLNIKKNLIGSILAGGVHSANAHFANILLALYLATGQDAANIVEGSQGITHAQMQGSDLYFSVSLPNIIVGTVGNGKDLDFVKENLQKMGCLDLSPTGVSSRRLAIITAATVLAGELSLLAAQTNPGELISSHLMLERAKREEK